MGEPFSVSLLIVEVSNQGISSSSLDGKAGKAA